MFTSIQDAAQSGLPTISGSLHVATPDVEAMAKRLIADNPELAYLRGEQIQYLMTESRVSFNGRPAAAKAQALGTNLHILTTPYRFVITINEALWDRNHYDREAILFEVLWACDIDADGKYGVRKPDVSAYSRVLAKYPRSNMAVEQLDILDEIKAKEAVTKGEVLRPVVEYAHAS